MKAHELIEILKQNPDAEILTTSDDNWCLLCISGTNYKVIGDNIDGYVDNYNNREEVSDDGVVHQPIFILW